MSKGMHQVEVRATRSEVWEFIRDMNQWAPLVPGYKSHHIHSENLSSWTFTVQYGVVKKKLSVKVLITEWKEPSQVTFVITGINHKLTGKGSFRAVEKNNRITSMTGYLEIEAMSPVGKLLQASFDTMVHDLTRDLTAAVGKAIEKGKA
ncbi:CoxG family protein [Bacillus sp. KH172YL63]|uniref:CoxG family protein n=1 Tax=Bacillus sp. KH172YL63 TaxID=2709784 RepID=UPI0013E43A3D|nr:SRPBCC family protein [Bacillus sp. KH172YL63]BCB03845.1 hypothetical protein KH172YL63_19780 [Bacillus sp. KH172YL63]